MDHPETSAGKAEQQELDSRDTDLQPLELRKTMLPQRNASPAQERFILPPRPGFVAHLWRNRGIFGVLFVAWIVQLLIVYLSPETQLAKGPSLRWKPPVSDNLEGAEGEVLASKALFSVRTMVQEAWSAYKTHALGFDDLQPASRTGRNWYKGGSLLITPIDALSTFALLGMSKEFGEARDMLSTSSFELPDFVSFFEITIRNLGGLLSAFELTGRSDRLFLDKAVDLADRLIYAFDPTTGLPWRLVNLVTGERKDANNVPMAEIASFQLEFLYLSEMTGDCKYAEYAYRVNDVLWDLKKAVAESPFHVTNIFPFDIDPTNLGLGSSSGILSVGGGVDSFYEYLLKQYIQTGRKDSRLWTFFEESVDAIIHHLALSVRFPANERWHHFFSKGWYNATSKKVVLDGSMEHLACFFGGTLALASEFGNFTDTAKRDQYYSWAQKLTDTCMLGYEDSRIGLAPEIMNLTVHPIRPRSGGPGERVYILRPETIESVFYLHRYSHDKKYRVFARRMIQALQQYTRVAGGHGFSGIVDVHPSADQLTYTNLQESFFLSETLKYLALIFMDDKVLPFETTVLTTEAHVLAVFPDGGKCKRQ